MSLSMRFSPALICLLTSILLLQGISTVCHGSSAGTGPCLKRIITAFALPDGHPLAALSAVQRLRRIGITVHALAPRHMIGRGADDP